MNKILTAVALAIALPAVAHAQAASAPEKDCCEKMKSEGKKCCCDKEHADMKHGHADTERGQQK
jgi:hypothetical protein